MTSDDLDACLGRGVCCPLPVRGCTVTPVLVGMLVSAVAVLALGAGFLAGRFTMRPVERALASAVEDRYAALLRVSALQQALEDTTQERDAAQLQARTDPLTGLANRAGLLADMAARAAGHLPWVLALVDVDNFKWINTTYGYAAGDQVLVEVGRRLTSIVVDGDGLVGRLGGDELVIAVHGEMPWLVAQQVQLALRRPVVVADGRQVQVTASVGLVQAMAEDKVRALLHSADTALHAAKLYGKARAVEYDPTRELIDVQTERPAVRVRQLTGAGTPTGVVRMLAEVPDGR